eukprot:6188892-Pleurochrysis_carterae.AAC.5
MVVCAAVVTSKTAWSCCDCDAFCFDDSAAYERGMHARPQTACMHEHRPPEVLACAHACACTNRCAGTPRRRSKARPDRAA